MSITTVHAEAPPMKVHVKRLSEELRNMESNTNLGWEVDPQTAICIKALGRRRGWRMVQKKHGDKIVVWRIA
jgi:hypothetical protein